MIGMQGAEQHRAPIRMMSAYGLALVGAMAAVYLVSQILRNSIGVIAPNLAEEVGLSAAQLGLLSSAFFFAFALAQVPLGLGLDRFGPKLCMLVCTAVLLVGTALFAVATSAAGLIGARVLIGLGSSCYLMAPLAFYARRFPPERFATLAGIQLSIGTLGTLIATAPLAFSAAAIGWRVTFWLIAAAVLVAGAVVAVVLPGERADVDTGRRHETLRESLAGTVAAMRTPSLVRLFLMHLAGYSSLVLILGLWGGPYLAHVYGYGLTERGDLLFLIAAGQIVGLALNGPVERWLGGVKIPVVVGSGVTGTLLLLLAALGTLPRTGLVVWLILFGLFSAYSPVLIAHGRALFPEAVLGRGMTLLNIGTMLGVFTSQAVTGVIINLFPVSDAGAYPLAAYRTVFAVQAACMLMAILPYLRTRDPLRDKNALGSAA